MSATPPPPPEVPFAEAARVWARVAAQSFGGPAGQIAVMHRILVEEKRWVSEERFLHALSYCMLLPGPEAQQLATYLGWLLHRTRGGLLAGILFVLPGAVVMLALSLLYVSYRDAWLLAGLFYGMKPAVVAVVAEAVARIGRKALAGRWQWIVAALSFAAIFFCDLPFPAIVAGAALAGLLAGRSATATAGGDPPEAAAAGVADRAALAGRPASPGRSLRVLAIGLFAWCLPPLLLYAWLGRDHVLLDQAFFFSQAAVVTFGGAYAVLAYVGQEAVGGFGWLSPREMLDGLGLAETTPGPLILVVQFVAFLGAYRHPGALDPLTAGILGSALTTWATFVPSFVFIFLGAPYVEALRHNRRWRDALAGITAAVVGVILNLALFFALHTLFAEVRNGQWSLFRLPVPVWSSLDGASLALAAFAFAALFRFKLGMGKTLAASSLAGLVIYLLRG
jgi:chromate transporter